jgi:hypothetical protein
VAVAIGDDDDEAICANVLLLPERAK